MPPRSAAMHSAWPSVATAPAPISPPYAPSSRATPARPRSAFSSSSIRARRPTRIFRRITPSRRDTSLTRRTILWFHEHYRARAADRDDFRYAPLICKDLSRLPPALIIIGEYDPLRDDGIAYARRLEAAGNEVGAFRLPRHGPSVLLDGGCSRRRPGRDGRGDRRVTARVCVTSTPRRDYPEAERITAQATLAPELPAGCVL